MKKNRYAYSFFYYKNNKIKLFKDNHAYILSENSHLYIKVYVNSKTYIIL